MLLGKHTYHQNFLICDISQDGILGQDYLLSHVKKIDYQQMVLHTGQCGEIKCWIGVHGVQSPETTTLPSNSGILIPISIPEAEHFTKLGLVEPCTENTGIYTVPGTLDLQSDKFYFNVLNTSSNSITLHANQQLGTCASYDDLLVDESIRATSLIGDTYTSPGTDTVPPYLQDLLERSSEHLNKDQIAALQNLLVKYSNVFSESSENIGRTNLTKHKINTGTVLSIRQPCRRLPIGKRDKEKEELNKMIDRGIIEPPSSPWASNIVLVLKKDG